MIDRLRICIPFREQFLQHSSQVHADGHRVDYVDLHAIAKFTDIRLSARDVEFDIDTDSFDVSGLNHPYESLPSHFGGLAFKIYQGAGMSSAHVEIKASPAKILQGHNVFGPTDISLCAFEMISILNSAVPDLDSFVDWQNAYLGDIDCTYSADVGSIHNAKQVIAALKNVSNGHMRSAIKNEHETTCYFNVNSRHADKKAYCKGPELDKQIRDLQSICKRNKSKLHLLSILKDEKLINFAANLIRFEGRAKTRLLNRMGIPTNLFTKYSDIDGSQRLGIIDYQRQFEKHGDDLIQHIFNEMFNPLFQAFEGQDMNVYDDSAILEKLKQQFFTITPKGNISYSKALRLFGFYRRLTNEGYQSVKNTLAPRTFYDNLNLMLSCGLSKAQLQNLHGDKSNNVIPLLRIINIDFSRQKPDWYVQPKSRFENVTPLIRSVA
jgi:II/X family phage/plasmid replication protein